MLDFAYVVIEHGSVVRNRAVSGVGAIGRAFENRRSTSGCFFPQRTHFVRDTDGLRYLDLDRASADEFSRLIEKVPARVLMVEWTYRRRWWGIWVPAIEPVDEHLAITCFDGSTRVTPAEAGELRIRHFAIIRTGVDPGAKGIADPTIVALSKPDRRGVDVHWAAVLHNALASTVALGLGTSLFSLVRTRKGKVERRFLSRGLCPKCRYDIHSIVPDATGQRTCPECGSTWAF